MRARWSGTTKPANGLGCWHQTRAPPPNEKKERKKLEGGKGDRNTEHDLDQAPKSTGAVPERQGETGDDDDDHRDDLGDRSFHRLQDLLQWLLPRAC